MSDLFGQRIEIDSGSGCLAGMLHSPPGATRAVIVSHCFTCHKNYRIPVHFCREASRIGVAGLRFDFAGLGESEGQFEDTTVTGYVESLVSAATWLQSQGLEVVALIGHSLGGAIGVLAAHRLPSVRGVGVVATSSDLGDLHRRFIPDAALPDRSVSVRIGGSTFVLTRSFLKDLANHSLLENVTKLDRSFLVLHGTGDSTVSTEHGERLFAAAKQPKSFHALPGADHLVSGKESLKTATRIFSVWLQEISSSHASPQISG